MKKIILIIFSLPITILTNPRIMLHVRDYPKLDVNIAKDLKTRHPKEAREKVLSAAMPSHPVTGLFATYAGFITVSAKDGSLIFPRKQVKSKFHVVVTPLIEPIMMLGTTIHHWELLKTQPVVIYTVELKHDEDTKLWYWQTEKKDLTNNRVIPLDSLVLFAPPTEVVVPLGASRTYDDTNLVMPDIYVKESFRVVPQALSTLNTKHFFRQILKSYKPGSGETQNTWLMHINER